MKDPTFDEDGYPTDETLYAITKWPHEDGYYELMVFVSGTWHWPDFMYVNPIKNIFGEPVWEYTMITGGWSGNEDIVAALRNNPLFYAMCWRESHRGGKHVFEVKHE